MRNDAACEPLCSQLFFWHSPVPALRTPTWFIPPCLCCAAALWVFFSFAGDNCPKGVVRKEWMFPSELL